MTAQTSSVPKYFQTMSTAPPSPKPSNPPPSFGDQPTTTTTTTTTAQASSSKPQHFPKPKLRLELRDLSHDSTDVFLNHFQSSKDLSNLVGTVLRLLYTTDNKAEDHDTALSTRPAPTKPNIPDTRSVTLILRDMGGVAYTTGTELDDDHKEIHLSLEYISHVARGKTSTRTELLGVVCHELVHCFQWNANGTAPGGLIEGIADWVRLNAGFVPPHWRKDADGDWDRGYQNTGYFLDWIEQTKGKGSIYRLNQALSNKDYKESHFWSDLFGDDVHTLYGHYREALDKENDTK